VTAEAEQVERTRRKTWSRGGRWPGRGHRDPCPGDPSAAAPSGRDPGPAHWTALGEDLAGHRPGLHPPPGRPRTTGSSTRSSRVGLSPPLRGQACPGTRSQRPGRPLGNASRPRPSHLLPPPERREIDLAAEHGELMPEHGELPPAWQPMMSLRRVAEEACATPRTAGAPADVRISRRLRQRNFRSYRLAVLDPHPPGTWRRGFPMEPMPTR
jgi:hypothetical protein